MEVLYALCSATAAFVCILLARQYRRTKVRLLLFGAFCFAGLALNNLLVLVDARTPETDLSVWRSLPALVGILLMLYGLVWESR